VIEHSVPLPTPVRYSGIKPCGITVVNGLNERGRRVGQDIFLWMRERAPLDLLGMGSEAIGGLGEVGNIEVGQAMADYRFFFSPVRYGSLSLALVEAMLIGMPIVGLAATELPTIITNGINGYVHTDKRKLLDVMQQLLDEPELARQWGMAARATALQRFSMNR